MSANILPRLFLSGIPKPELLPINQDGTIGPASNIAGINFATASVAVADFDGDGQDDVVLGSDDNTKPLFILPSSNGGLASSLSVADGLYFVEAADMDNDGNVDIIAIEDTGTKIVLLNNGIGFTQYDTFLGSPSGGTNAVCLHDFNGDGYLDAVGVNVNRVALHLNDATGILTYSHEIYIPVGTYYSCEVTDFDNDGHMDVVVGGASGTSYDVILYNNGDGESFTAVELAGSQGFVGLGDFNNDGLVDIISQYGAGGPNFIWKNNGSRLFVRETFGLNVHSLTRTTHQYTVVDLDGDGWLDIVVAAMGVGAYVYMNNQYGTSGIPVFMNSTSIPSSMTNVNQIALLDFVDGTEFPSLVPSNFPSSSTKPSAATEFPSNIPSIFPSSFPSTQPSVQTVSPSSLPSTKPSAVTNTPSITPSIRPSSSPSIASKAGKKKTKSKKLEV